MNTMQSNSATSKLSSINSYLGKTAPSLNNAKVFEIYLVS